MKLAPGFDPRKLTPELGPAFEAIEQQCGISETTAYFKETDGRAIVFAPYHGNLELIAQGIRERLNQHHVVEVDLGAIIVSLVE